MSQATAIEWTDLSWNPVHGCSKVSPGCAHCYAETLSLRYKHTLKPWTPGNAGENVLLKPHKLREPLSNGKAWRGLGDAAAAAGKTDGMLVFANSTSDLFHDEVPDEFIGRVFATMAVAARHDFQVLTKRPERMQLLLSMMSNFREHLGELEAFMRGFFSVPFQVSWPLPNVWLGVSIENRRYVGRADLLRETPAAVRFISAEPLLGPLVHTGGGFFARGSDGFYHLDWPDGYIGDDLNLNEIDWLIVGGESGARHRPIDPEWVRALRDRCDEGWFGLRQGKTAFFLKQWGGRTPKAGGRELDGRTWDQFPTRKAPVT